MALCESLFRFVSLGMFGMFRWVCMFRSLCFSKMQATRPRCNQFFAVGYVAYARTCVICENWSKNYYQLGATNQVQGAKL
jgi:hypothetical protein